MRHELREERRRALQAMDGQLASLRRLDGLRDRLLTMAHAAVVGAESVATRMGEVVTLGAAATEPERAGQVIADASHDLAALRSGLLEAQQLPRGVGRTIAPGAPAAARAALPRRRCTTAPRR